MFSVHHLFSFLFINALIITISAQQISTYTELCKRSSLKFNKCMKDALQLYINDLQKDSIDDDSLDSWELPELPLVYDAGSSDKMSVSLRDVSLHGLSSLKIKNVRSSLKDKSKLKMEIDLFDPHMHLSGNYTVELKSSSEVPIYAEGVFNISMNNLKGTLLLKGRTVKRDHIEYLQVDKALIKPELGSLHIDIFGNNDPYPELTALVMSLVNQYWRVLYYEALPLLEEGLDGILRSYIDDETRNIPFDSLVPA